MISDRQWQEDRFWAEIYDAATDVGRGELARAMERIGSLRAVCWSRWRKPGITRLK